MMEDENVALKDVLSSLVTELKGKPSADQLDLPIFRPDIDDPIKWIDYVEAIRTEFELTDLQLLVRIGRFLLHNAKRWYERWTPDKRDWGTFRRDFLEAFPCKRNLGRLLDEAAVYNSSCCNTYEAYVHEKLLRLRNLRASWTERDMVDLVIHGISESSVKNCVMNRDCQTVAELLTFLSSYPKKIRNEDGNLNFLLHKKRRLDSPIAKNNVTCYLCGKKGHLRVNCRYNTRTMTKSFDVPSTSSQNFKNGALDACSFCAKKGHSADICFIKAAIDKRKRVNYCVANQSIGATKITIDGIEFSALIDTGADVSLISNKFMTSFKDKIEPCSASLKGIVPGQIVANWKFSAETEITGEKVFITYYVVPNAVLDYDVFIGRDLYEDHSLVMITDFQGSRVIRRQLPGINRIVELSASDRDIDFRVPREYRDQLIIMLEKNKDIITTGNRVGRVNNTSMEIRLEKDIVVNRAPYRLAINERAAVRQIIDDLLTNGIIRESISPFASPILLVRKKEGTYRMCVDYRELNRHTIKDRYPLPLIEDQLDRLAKGRYFTSLDMASGFYQIPVHDDSIHRTAFVTPDGHYEFLRMPFGLANATAVFQKSINKALGSLRHTIALVYIDDILIPSETPQEGFQFLNQVLEALKFAGFSLNIKKCSFLQSSVEYLGREISAEGVRPGNRKIQALMESPVPKDAKGIRQFMGLAGYFRKFVPNFATKTAVITKLTKKNEPFVWTREHDAARNYVISCLTSGPTLAVYDPNLPTELHTDASSLGYGAILFQRHEGQLRVVGYFSRRTNIHEEKYHSYELETLAIVNALKHFRVYLLGIPFTLITDCNAVKCTANKKDIIPRIARWWVYMQDFNFTIVYRKGSTLSHVDFLSRNPINVRRVANKNWLYVEQKGNAEVRKMIDELRDGKLDGNQYCEKDGLLLHQQKNDDGTKKMQWFVPRQSRLGLLRIFHDEQCHIGPDKTYLSIAEHFWFPRMRNFVKNYVKHCLVCAVKKTRTGPLQGFIQPLEKPSVPFHTLHADCLGPLPITSEGFKYILVIVDAFSKYCLLFPMKATTAAETKERMQSVIALFGTPQRIIMDAASNFKNTTFPKFLSKLQIESHYVTPDVHRGNGQVERYMRTIMNLIRIETKIKSEWSSGLWKIQLVLNSTIQKSTKTTPLQLMLGINKCTPIVQALLRDLGEDLTPFRNRKLDRERVDTLLQQGARKTLDSNRRRRDTVQYAPGDFVLMHRDSVMHISKTDYEFLGPYEIKKCLGKGRYELLKVGSKITTKAAKEQLRPWPKDWVVTCEMEQLIQLLEIDD